MSKSAAAKWCVAVVVALAVVGLTGCPPPGPTEITVTVTDTEGGAEALDREELVALARREGEMWWYTSLPENQAREFLRGFESEYPFIQSRLVRGSTFDTVRRIDREIGQGMVRADALHVLDPAVFADLRRRGELYVFEPAQARYLPPQYRDPGRWWAMRAGTCRTLGPNCLMRSGKGKSVSRTRRPAGRLSRSTTCSARSTARLSGGRWPRMRLCFSARNQTHWTRSCPGKLNSPVAFSDTVSTRRRSGRGCQLPQSGPRTGYR